MRTFTPLIFALLVGCASVVPNVDEALTPGIFLDLGARASLPAGVELRPVSLQGLQVTMVGEGWRPRLYNDVARYCTIGYGHLIKRAPCDGSEPDYMRVGLSKERGQALLVDDMAAAQIAVMTAVNTDLTDNEYAALCDFVFNVGATNFRNSRLLAMVNARQFDQVPVQLRRWTMAGGKQIKGLVNRRENEIALFFNGKLTPRSAPPADEDISPLDIRTGR